MPQFHVGQEVEVFRIIKDDGTAREYVRCPAKIIAVGGGIQSRLKPGDCEVEFADGTHGVFNDRYIGAPSQQYMNPEPPHDGQT